MRDQPNDRHVTRLGMEQPLMEGFEARDIVVLQ
jgi:hypothetical protein